MTLMARATEKSGADIQAMTHRMQVDARMTKFLTEIAAIFLPIGTMSVSYPYEFLRKLQPHISLSIQ
jgi:hypothetical protein